MDNYYLNNAVYLVEEFLEGTTEPYYGGRLITAIEQSTVGIVIGPWELPFRSVITPCTCQKYRRIRRLRRLGRTLRAGATEPDG